MFFSRLLLPCLVALTTALPARAITIDAFLDDGAVSSTATVGSTRTLHVSSAQALGSGRTLSATKSGSGSGVSRIEVVDTSLGYTQGAHSGFASVTWDGDSDPATIKPNGLGSIDFTQDGGTAFKIGLIFFDYPSNESIRVVLKLFDSSTPTGTRFSEVSVTLNQFYGGPEVFYITLPFAMFTSAGNSTVPAPQGLTFTTTTTVGSAGAADVTRIGAISLALRGDLNSRAPDIILAPFTTNGRCKAVPDATGRAIDECSVCHEDPNAKRGVDRCGVCLHGVSGYSYEANKIFDACGLCPGESHYQYPTGVMDRCGTCLGGPPPYAYIDKRDACGVCGGTTRDKAQCTVGSNGCPLVKPTGKIVGFEKKLVAKADLLRSRYRADVRRAQSKNCAISFVESTRRVSEATSSIKQQSRDVFRRGIEVCGGECVTVSYADDVEALRPHFRVLEEEASKAAKLVKQCYRRLGINKETQRDGPGETARTVAAVRTGLGNLIRECRRTSVCKSGG
jgi:hypothetical protein